MKPQIVRVPARQYFFKENCFVTEIYNTSEDPALSIARVRVAARTRTRWHRLDVDERYLIVEGTGIMELDGVAPTEVGLSDVVVVPAGCAQRICNETDNDLIVYCLCTPRFTPDVYHDAPDMHVPWTTRDQDSEQT